MRMQTAIRLAQGALALVMAGTIMWLAAGRPGAGVGAGVGAQANRERGSLIVGVPVQSGWVVCGDKRVISPIRGVRDDETKVFQIRRSLVFGVTGLQRMIELVDGEIITRFSVADVVRKYLSTRPFAGTQGDVRGLGDELVSAFETYLAQTPPDGRPPSGDADSSGFSVAVFWVDKSGPIGATLRLPFRQRLTIEVSHSRGAIDGGPRPVGFGNTRVWLELERGKRQAFAQARADATIGALLSPDSGYVTTSRRDAERFARRMIATTSEMNPLLGVTPSDVGPTMDCFQVAR